MNKKQASFVRSLRQEKFRKIFELFIVEGPKVVEEFIKSDFNIDVVYGLEEWLEENISLLNSYQIRYEEISETDLENLSRLKTPNKVIALVKFPPESPDINLEGLTLALDDISDPGNLGTIIRIADWYGIKNIICSLDTVDVYNPKVVQASMGSLSRVKLHYLDLKFFLEQCNEAEIPIYGADLEGDSLYEQSLDLDGIVLVGNESNGISDELLKFVTNRITIPRFSDSATESLNASVATGIIINEFRRQYAKNQ